METQELLAKVEKYGSDVAMVDNERRATTAESQEQPAETKTQSPFMNIPFNKEKARKAKDNEPVKASEYGNPFEDKDIEYQPCFSTKEDRHEQLKLS